MTSFLIVRLGSLGDVVHAIPFAAALRAAFPTARIDWMVDPQYAALLELVPAVDRRLAMDPRWAARTSGWRRFMRTIREIRAARYDVVFDLQGLLKSAALARAAGARRTVGFVRGRLREPLAATFYTERLDTGGAPHVIQQNLALLAAVGVADRRVRFPLSGLASPAVDEVMGRFRGGFALINPGAAWPNKRWPAERFGALAASLEQRRGLRSLVLWGPGERSLAEAVAAASAGAADVSPPTGIRDILGLARAARVMISGDTGPLHLGGAAGAPLVALFGPTRPERNGPWAAADEVISRVDRCECLYERRCRRDVPCIDDIDPGEVLAAVERRLDREA